MLPDIEQDRGTLRTLCESLGYKPDALKEAGAWLLEKVGRVKLRISIGEPLGIFEALEFLELGVQGKLGMWRALAVAAVEDSRLRID